MAVKDLKRLFPRAKAAYQPGMFGDSTATLGNSDRDVVAMLKLTSTGDLLVTIYHEGQQVKNGVMRKHDNWQPEWY